MKRSRDNENEFYTGNSSKNLIVHVMQNGVEVAKPIKSKIYEQKVVWNKRQYPVVPSRFYYDHKGVAHQQVDANDVAVLTYHKDHEDNCRKCGGKMTIDARQARMLGRNGVFHAIWGIDSSHMVLIIIFAIGAMAMAGFAFYSYNQDTLHKTQLESAQKEVARLNAILNPNPDSNVNPDGSISGGNRR
jgi:hypothetical protein